jgi:branched-chain amino acid transport system permease protein
VVGAVSFTLLQSWLLTSEFWRFKLGAVILLLVLAFPAGIAGAVAAWRERGR